MHTDNERIRQCSEIMMIFVDSISGVCHRAGDHDVVDYLSLDVHTPP